MQFGLWETTTAFAILILIWRLPTFIQAWFHGKAELEKARKPNHES